MRPNCGHHLLAYISKVKDPAQVTISVSPVRSYNEPLKPLKVGKGRGVGGDNYTGFGDEDWGTYNYRSNNVPFSPTPLYLYPNKSAKINRSIWWSEWLKLKCLYMKVAIIAIITI